MTANKRTMDQLLNNIDKSNGEIQSKHGKVLAKLEKLKLLRMAHHKAYEGKISNKSADCALDDLKRLFKRVIDKESPLQHDIAKMKNRLDKVMNHDGMLNSIFQSHSGKNVNLVEITEIERE